ncbi:MAG: hypothetical protein NTV10_08305 [Methanoregula sp.]|nr:hypothetical protein [Methanoregula sp.]
MPTIPHHSITRGKPTRRGAKAPMSVRSSLSPTSHSPHNPMPGISCKTTVPNLLTTTPGTTHPRSTVPVSDSHGGRPMESAG